MGAAEPEMILGEFVTLCDPSSQTLCYHHLKYDM